MAAKQVTEMKLKVDLQCHKCYKKVKKVLCKFPQIRDQIYDEEKNTVTIKVVCCCPEKLRDKLCCRGGGSIRSIEIMEPPKPKPPKPKEAEKKKDPGEQSPPRPRPPSPEPSRPVDHGLPPTGPRVMFPEPVPVSVFAYPSPAASVGLLYQGGFDGPRGFYGEPVYDGYGGTWPYCVGCQHLGEEDAAQCTII